MGSLLDARCPCGYQRDTIVSGSGMAGDEFLPARCMHCREIVTVRTDRRRLRCSRCGRKPEVLRLYDPGSLDETFPDGLYICPRCERETLRFEFSGIWD